MIRRRHVVSALGDLLQGFRIVSSLDFVYTLAIGRSLPSCGSEAIVLRQGVELRRLRAFDVEGHDGYTRGQTCTYIELQWEAQ